MANTNDRNRKISTKMTGRVYVEQYLEMYDKDSEGFRNGTKVSRNGSRKIWNLAKYIYYEPEITRNYERCWQLLQWIVLATFTSFCLMVGGDIFFPILCHLEHFSRLYSELKRPIWLFFERRSISRKMQQKYGQNEQLRLFLDPINWFWLIDCLLSIA